MKQGDIYAVDMEPTKGREQRGKRPVLIVSKTSFNACGTPICVPITGGGDYSRIKGFTVPLSGAGTRTEGVIVCHQMRALDLSERNGRRVEAVPKEILDDVINHILPIFED